MAGLAITPIGTPVEELKRVALLAIWSRGLLPASLQDKEAVKNAEREIFARGESLFVNLQLVPFISAGWAFVPWSGTDAQLIKLRQDDRLDAVEYVYKGSDPEQRLLIGSRNLWARFKPEVTPEQRAAAVAAHGLVQLRTLGLVRDLVQFRVPVIADPGEVGRKLLPLCQYVELDYDHVTPGREFDPRRQKQMQWPMIDASDAWDIATGRGARAAIIDHGFDVRHEDFHGGIDFDTAAVFSFRGRDVELSVPGEGNFPTNRAEHGTKCLGLLGARRNAVGVRGLAFESALVPIVVPKSAPQSVYARAIAYALDPSTEQPSSVPSTAARVKVVSCSLGPDTGEARRDIGPVLNDVLNAAAQQELFIAWAVSNRDTTVRKDQVCSHPAVDAIGGIHENGSRCNSAVGPPLSCVAPAYGVLTTTLGNCYDEGNGQSMAAPLVAGLAALLIGHRDTATIAQVRTAIQQSCQDPRQPSQQYGYGLIEAKDALKKLDELLKASAVPPTT